MIPPPVQTSHTSEALKQSPPPGTKADGWLCQTRTTTTKCLKSQKQEILSPSPACSLTFFAPQNADDTTLL